MKRLKVCYFSKLPDDCICEISDFFETSKDVFSFMLTCKAHYNLFHSKNFFGCKNAEFSPNLEKFYSLERTCISGKFKLNLPDKIHNFVRIFCIKTIDKPIYDFESSKLFRGYDFSGIIRQFLQSFTRLRRLETYIFEDEWVKLLPVLEELEIAFKYSEDIATKIDLGDMKKLRVMKIITNDDEVYSVEQKIGYLHNDLLIKGKSRTLKILEICNTIYKFDDSCELSNVEFFHTDFKRFYIFNNDPLSAFGFDLYDYNSERTDKFSLSLKSYLSNLKYLKGVKTLKMNFFGLIYIAPKHFGSGIIFKNLEKLVVYFGNNWRGLKTLFDNNDFTRLFPKVNTFVLKEKHYFSLRLNIPRSVFTMDGDGPQMTSKMNLNLRKIENVGICVCGQLRKFDELSVFPHKFKFENSRNTSVRSYFLCESCSFCSCCKKKFEKYLEVRICSNYDKCDNIFCIKCVVANCKSCVKKKGFIKSTTYLYCKECNVESSLKNVPLNCVDTCIGSGCYVEVEKHVCCGQELYQSFRCNACKTSKKSTDNKMFF